MALSDGLFAIVLTLLVLDLKPQTAEGVNLTYADLVQLWPRLFAFFLTFLVGGSYWIAHHTDLTAIESYDRAWLWLNLMFLLSVSLLPFTTALIGQETRTIAWTLYALNVISMGLTLAALWGYAELTGLSGNTTHHVTTERQYQSLRYLVIPVVFGASIPVSFIAPSVAPYTALLAPPLFRVAALLARPHRRRAARSQRAPACGWWSATRRAGIRCT